MRHYGLSVFGVCTALLSGCGARPVGPEHDRAEREVAPMHGTLGAFHDVFALVYHMDKGSERDAAACSHASDLSERAKHIVSDLRADKDPAFKAAASALAQRVGELGGACSEHDAVEAKLETIHEAFHATLESAHEGEVGHGAKPDGAHGHP